MKLGCGGLTQVEGTSRIGARGSKKNRVGINLAAEGAWFGIYKKLSRIFQRGLIENFLVNLEYFYKKKILKTWHENAEDWIKLFRIPTPEIVETVENNEIKRLKI